MRKNTHCGENLPTLSSTEKGDAIRRPFIEDDSCREG